MVTTTRERTEDVRPAIMTKPLPQILSELEDYIGRVEEAVKQARTAAGESREAATQAKAAGEKAAEAAVAKVREEATDSINALGVKIAGLEAEVHTLKDHLTLEAQCLDKAFDALKDRHMEESPFLRKKQAAKAESAKKNQTN